MVSLEPVVDRLGYLTDRGFVRKGGLLLRQDRVLRGVVISQSQADGDWATFFVNFDLGIPVLSEAGARRSRHVLRCSGNRFASRELGFTGSFELRRGAGDEEVLDVVRRTAEAVSERFLLRYPDEDALFETVYRAATGFMDEGPGAADELTRLELNPWNVMARLELAGVYAAFLGKDEVADVKQRARAYPTGRNASLDYLVGPMMATIDSAAALSGRHAG